MARPEPMNATPHHSKARVSLQFSDPLFIAGEHVTGKMELECKADKGLGINVIQVELFAIQELTSRDHSATSTFLHLTRCFQGPGLPPSNAVYPHPLPGSDTPPVGYFQARKGTTTFFFRIPLPYNTPSSIEFGKGLAKLKYEVRASVGIAWRDERQFVMERKGVEVVEAPGEPAGGTEQVIVGENGKLWVQGRILNPYIVAGSSACVELFVKNHSTKKTSSLTLNLTRHLHLPTIPNPSKALQISDTLLSVPFRGPDYIVHPGTEGIANLVFVVPSTARGIRAGGFDSGDDDDPRQTESLFDVQCKLEIKIGMGFGSKDVILELPVTVMHPAAMKAHSPPARFASPGPMPYALPTSPTPYAYRAYSPQPAEPYYPNYISHPISPPAHAQPWSATSQLFYPMFPVAQDQYYYPPPPVSPINYPIRPASADPLIAQQLPILPTLAQSQQPNLLLAVPTGGMAPDAPAEGELGKGERASRISTHLRMSSRTRSVSPQSHRFPAPMVLNNVSPKTRPPSRPLPVPVQGSITQRNPNLLSISPRSDAELLSPRPVLSPKHSFTIDRGTVKSERVVDLERMAAEELAAEELAHKELPRRPPSPKEETPETPKLLPQPTLAPAASRARPDIWTRESGLEALERKLLQQVGTRKPDAPRRADVRTVLPMAIPPPKEPRGDPPNDSAISSLALGIDGPKGGEWLTDSPKDDTKEYHTPSLPILPKPDEKPVDAGLRGRGKVREKHTEAHQLRKAATGRVAAWLGEIDTTVPPPACETPPISSPSTPAEDISMVDHGPHPLLRSPPIPSPAANTYDSALVDAIPVRSSGFVLHAARDSSTFEPLKPDHDGDSARASTPTQVNPDPTPATPVQLPVKGDKPHASPNPVLKRIGNLALIPPPSDAKYDVRSARGGRGGKVTSVAAVWASLASQSGVTPPALPARPKPIISNTDFKVPRKKAPIVVPPPLPKRPEAVDTNVADLTARRARMIKSTSVPAILSSSLATPVLSSTASLARPLRSNLPIKEPYPKTSTPATHTIPPSASFPTNRTTPVKSPPAIDVNFGQARLKDLIKKYQEGLGQ